METRRQKTRRRAPVPPAGVPSDPGRLGANPRVNAGAEPHRPPPHAGALFERLTAGGSEGNELLTVITGIVLIALLAVIGLTLLHLRTTLLSVHLFIGLLLVGPVLLKLGSTGYRFVRYYTHSPVYRRKGPPPAYLRALAPLVVLTTIVVFASGVALLLIGPSSRGALLPVHKVSFIAWAAFTSVHVLGHLPEVVGTLSGGRELRLTVLAGVASGQDSAPDGRPPGPPRDDGRHDLRAGRTGRALSLAVALVGGLLLALLLIPEFGPWLHYHRVLFDR